jgi:HD-like signal output (HDOD) protein
VGNEQPLWEDFRSRFPDGNGAWASEFVRTGKKALEVLEPFAWDAVVADVQLSDSSGLELLDEVMQRQPDALRIILSEKADTPGSLQRVGTANHHLQTPCDVSRLLDVLGQSLERETWLPSKVVQHLLAQMRQLPSPPTIYFKIASEMESPNVSVSRIGELITREPGIAAKVLQLANSAAFGLRQKLLRPEEAVAYIGFETTKALVLLAHTFSFFERDGLGGFCVESLCCHSVITGRFAERIARLEKSAEEIADQAFAAGLLHDIGKLVLAANLPTMFSGAVTMAKEQKVDLWEAEKWVLGASHSELGGCLLGIWGLPKPVVEAVALHHHPGLLAGERTKPLTFVHAANVIVHQGWADQPFAAQSQMDLDYFNRLGLASHIKDWQADCLGLNEALGKPNRLEPAELPCRT